MLRIISRFVSAVCFIVSGSAYAADYPSKPIKMNIGFSAGSATDLIGRILSEQLSKRLDQPIIVENKVGAGGSIAAQDTARSSADGYHILLVSSAIAVNSAVYQAADAVLDELAPIALIGYLPTVLMVSNDLPVSTMSEFIEYTKTNPGKVNFGSSGIGGSTHMAMEAFAGYTDTELMHIPYKGNGQASVALLGNEIDAMMETLLLAAPVINTGRAKGLAISTEQRSTLIPDVPTFTEAGVSDYDHSLFFGVMGPKNMPPALIEKLNSEINAVLQSPATRDRLVQTAGLTIANSTAQEFKEILVDEVELWKKVASSAGIAPQ
ncbi:Bug family tripartite tricarboxylate transporter substrate binding protein [Alcaligenes endophyticus]|uniref:Tripartite tricarboxylate transporter substrate binding protein n=1 Tax=Alcaligenes endophyticus TaxID=1929088 RepID=A0ABT8EFA6_9BURK|nr:tripartite tricarboxylate transporter substrate binding protein [Alcaligenes endophyticus]MCX5590393.1 tripartite tricarboxylate transporter substrate binding protein [Alcaligenes endophyticus]MDN4119943.1 tripartite tricarboxylate transporter substrate binding protein [Alcaligenes endophyticus]